MDNTEVLKIEVIQLRKKKTKGFPRIVHQISAVLMLAYIFYDFYMKGGTSDIFTIISAYWIQLFVLTFNFVQLRKKKIPLTLEIDGKSLKILSNKGVNLYDSKYKPLNVEEHKEEKKVYLIVEDSKTAKPQKLEIVFERKNEARLIETLGNLLDEVDEGRD